MSRPNTFIYIYVGLIPVLFGLSFLWFKPFDGIEFNGDSYRYYLSAIRLVDSIQNLTFPKPAFWPDGYPILIAILFQFVDMAFIHAQWINLCLTSLMSLTLYFIFFNSHPHKSNFNSVFIFTFLLLYFSGFILKYQLTIMSDIPALFWSVLTTFFLFRFLDNRKIIFLFSVSFSVAMAIMTRYVYGLMFIPIAVVLLYELKNRRLAMLYLTLLGAFVLVFSIPQLFLILQSPESSLNHPWVSKWSFSNFWILDRSSIDGNLTVRYPNFLYYLFIPFRNSEFTFIGFLLFSGGIFIAFKNGLNSLTIFFLIWFLSFYLFLCGILIQNPRFCLSLYIPIFYFIFIFLQFLFEIKFRQIIYAGLCLFIIVKIFLSTSFMSQTINGKNEMLGNAVKFSRMIPNETVIITWDFFEAYYIYFPEKHIETIHNLTMEKAGDLIRNHSNVALIFDEERLNTVWKNFPPAELYQQTLKKYHFRKIYGDGKYSILLGGENEK